MEICLGCRQATKVVLNQCQLLLTPAPSFQESKMALALTCVVALIVYLFVLYMCGAIVSLQLLQ